MTELPYMKFYVADYDAATSHLTLEEDGVYFRLLRLAWQTAHCSLPNNPEWIARKMRVTALQYGHVIKPILDEYFRMRDGQWSQKRQREVFKQSRDIIRKRRAAGQLGGLAKSLKTKESTPSKRGSKNLASIIRDRDIKINKNLEGQDFPKGSIQYTGWDEIARAYGGNWDINAIAAAFRSWAADKEIKQRSLVKTFTTFCRTYAADKGPT